MLDYPRMTRVGADLVADAEVLRLRRLGEDGRPLSWPKVAAELGVTPGALDKARERVRRAG